MVHQIALHIGLPSGDPTSCGGRRQEMRGGPRGWVRGKKMSRNPGKSVWLEKISFNKEARTAGDVSGVDLGFSFWRVDSFEMTNSSRSC